MPKYYKWLYLEHTSSDMKYQNSAPKMLCDYLNRWGQDGIKCIVLNVYSLVPCAGRFEYFRHSPAHCRGWWKENPVPGSITGLVLKMGDINTETWSSRFGATLFCDLQLNTLLLSAYIQFPLHCRRIQTPSGSSMSCAAHIFGHTDGQTSIFTCASAGMCINSKTHCSQHLLGWTRYNPNIFLTASLILTEILIYVKLNPILSIFFKLSLTLLTNCLRTGYWGEYLDFRIKK
jgi:hypothetical protein